MGNSTRARQTRKWADGRPPVPYKDFPLSPHASGHWCKKIKGKIHYFGRWGRRVNKKMERISGDGWEEALRVYKASVADIIITGRKPRLKNDELTVAELCNRFYTAKFRRYQADKMTARSFGDFCATTDMIVGHLGKDRLVTDLGADDFEAFAAVMAKRWGPVRLGNEIGRVRSVFKYAFDNHLIEQPVRFGTEFVKPTKTMLRRHKATSGRNLLFESMELRQLIDAAPTALKAMILLGINCGFGNADCATLPLSVINLDSGWIDYPRPKTGIERRCALWPETATALRDYLAERRNPRDDADSKLVFLTSTGRPWIRISQSEDPRKWNTRMDAVGQQFNRLLADLGLKSAGRGFYALRHVFRTVADGARDTVAADVIMGHSDPSMGAIYRERIEDSRLQAVSDHVRDWLYKDVAQPPLEVAGLATQVST